MGVYIKDMEMPKCCAECNFCYPSGGHFCHCIEEMYIPYDVFIEGRPDWCPLKEVDVITGIMYHPRDESQTMAND